jgi:hypothetical protein
MQKHKPRVAIKPQPYAQLRARYPEAVQTFMVVGRDVASNSPSHVFDTDDGLRFIISRDKLSGDKTSEDLDMLHVSVSTFVGGEDWSHLRTKQPNPAVRFTNATDAIRAIQVAAQKILGYHLPKPDHSGVTPGGVVHLLWKWNNKFLQSGNEVPLG